MSTYTPEQLREGINITSLSGSKTLQFVNPSRGSSYFFVEQNTNKNSDGSYNINIIDYTSGSFSNFTNIVENGIVQNKFKFGVVVPSENSSVIFTPTSGSESGNIKLRGTGNYTCRLSPSESIVTDSLILRADASDLFSYSGTGTTWIDVVNGNNGTINNGTAYTASQDGYFLFDGVDDQVDFGNPTIFESYPLSIDVWFYADTTDSKNDGIITKGTTRGSQSERDFDIFGNGTNLLFVISNGTSYIVNISSTYPALGQWHHLVCMWDGTTNLNGAKMYLNGSLFAQGTATNTNFATGKDIFVGGNRSGFFLDGRISAIKMYNKTLSAAEALQNYNATKDRYGL